MARPHKRNQTDHTIPRRPSKAALDKIVLKPPEHEERYIKEYVEIEAGDEEVQHLEKVATERLFDRKLDAWDVHTNKTRYWVITNPTNLYSQEDFPSLDYTLSLHVGVTERVFARNARKSPDAKPFGLEATWRHWEQAAQSLDDADESAEFQAVGMRCRECLLTLTSAMSTIAVVPQGQTPPKGADFNQWAELFANTVAAGASSEEVRSYLKTVSRSTWQLVNWLTHGQGAVRFDAELAVDAVQHLVSCLGYALIRYQRGTPDRCPNCASYKLFSDYRSDVDRYVTLCEVCGWNDRPDSASPPAESHP